MAGQYVTWTVPAATAGSYKVSFRYAATTAATRRLSANSGVVTNALSFSAKAANTWGTTTINVTLPAGTSTLKLDFLPNVSTGNLALDSLTLQKA